MKIYSYILIFFLFVVCCISKGNAQETFTDPRDGNVYKTVRIGNQDWMAENLRFMPTKGSRIYGGNIKNGVAYGLLYDWETARNVCPSGWHLPSVTEWRELRSYLYEYELDGDDLKESGTIHWAGLNTDATNKTGFTALPGGFGFIDMDFFQGIGEIGIWWTSTKEKSNPIYSVSLESDYVRIENTAVLTHVFSVRCIRD